MAIDGAFLCCMRQELEARLLGARVEKIHQPSREELVIGLRTSSGHDKLFLSSRVQAPRIHLTNQIPENPPQPPMFCMLLRKHLSGAKLVAIRQNGWERALYLDFETRNELGDLVCLTLAAELMGRNSNLILIGPDGRILDAVRRVDLISPQARPVLPGLIYDYPPADPQRLDLSIEEPQTIVTALQNGPDRPLSQAIGRVVQGVSPLLCREVSYLVTGDQDSSTSTLSPAQWDRVTAALEQIKTASLSGKGRCPYLLVGEDKTPLEFSFMPLMQYGLSAIGCEVNSFSELLDAFYTEKANAERIRQSAHDVFRVLTQASERISRKIGHQQQELASSADRENKRFWGDLINANQSLIPRGASQAQVINYYDPDCATVTIPLDPTLSAAQNAQRYYKAYRKAQTAERMLAVQIAAGQEELAYLETVWDALSRAQTMRELDELRLELVASGYWRASRAGGKKAPAPLKAMAFCSSDGFSIRVGRNNVGNDRLTLRDSHAQDIWLHTKNIPGSHVVIASDGQSVPERTIREAAILAATFSKAAASSQVPVDFTEIRHVRKPAGAKPGRVIYDSQQTLYVTPDRALAEALKQDS